MSARCNRRPPRLIATSLVIVTVLWSLASLADTIAVEITDDIIADDDDCSLREAILEANNLGTVDECLASDDGENPLTIQVPAGTYTLDLDAGDDDEDSDGSEGDQDILLGDGTTLIIAGSTNPDSPTIVQMAASEPFRVIELGAARSVELRDLTITGGHPADDNGGGIRSVTGSVLTLVRVEVVDNHITECDEGGDGGGIYAEGTLTVRDSRISDNSAADGAADGDGCYGGGLFTQGNTLLEDTQVSGNSAGEGDGTVGNGQNGGHGGGIYHCSADLTIVDSRILDNLAGDGGAGAGEGFNGGEGGDGGGLYACSAADVEIIDTEISGNSAGTAGDGASTGDGSGGNGGSGGGIFVDNVADSSLEVVGGVLDSNTAGAGGGGTGSGSCGTGGDGGAIAFLVAGSTELSLAGTTVNGNSAGDGGTPVGANASPGEGGNGGGIFANASTMSLERCVVTNNLAGDGTDAPGGSADGGSGGEGGGVSLGGSGTPSIDGCLFADNRAGDGGSALGSGEGGSGGDGGGLRASIPTLSVRNSTFSGNATGIPGEPRPGDPDGGGGGLYLDATTTISHTTIANNVAAVTGGGLLVSDDVTIKNSIVADNTATAGDEDGVFGHDCHSDPDDLTSADALLMGDTDGCDLVIAGSIDNQLDVDPVLEPLADNGGLMESIALGAGSPAIDAGTCLDIDDEPVLTDQRGLQRPRGNRCDIGAYERTDVVLLESEAEPAGENCPNGGDRIESGLDVNLDGALGDDEVDAVVYLCDGTDGADGETGSDGASALFEPSEIEAGDADCPAGGVALDVGLDTDGDGTLDPEEVSDTVFLCSGEAGAPGMDGQDVPADGTGGGAPSACSVSQSGGSTTITCNDGTTASIAAPDEGCCATAGGSRPDPVVALAVALVVLTARRRRGQR